MTEFVAYKNEYTKKAFQTPEGCLRSEFDHLRDLIHPLVDVLMPLPWLDFGKQCDLLRAKIDALEAKGREYQQAMRDKQPQGAALNPIAPADMQARDQESKIA